MSELVSSLSNLYDYKFVSGITNVTNIVLVKKKKKSIKLIIDFEKIYKSKS